MAVKYIYWDRRGADDRSGGLCTFISVVTEYAV